MLDPHSPVPKSHLSLLLFLFFVLVVAMIGTSDYLQLQALQDNKSDFTKQINDLTNQIKALKGASVSTSNNSANNSSSNPLFSPSATSSTSSPTSSISPSTSPSSSTKKTSLTYNLVNNATYPVGGSQFTLKNGSATVKIGSTTYNYTLTQSHVALGDLNNDGVTDAVAVLYYNTGGSGSFPVVYTLVAGSGSINTTLSNNPSLDDRDIVDSVNINTNSEVNFAEIVHSSKDSLAEPTLKKSETFTLQASNDQLVKMSDY